MIKRIMLDMDGVCNCMIMHTLELLGCQVSRYCNDQWPNKGDYDFGNAVQSLLGITLSRTEILAKIPRQLWANTPPSAEFGWLLQACDNLVGLENTYFLTSPTDDPDSLAGKKEWITRFAPRQLWHQYEVGPAKHLAANPHTLLIDDSDIEIARFLAPPDGVPGGQAILFPRPWNSGFNLDPIATVQKALDELNPGPTPLQTQYSHLKLIPEPITAI